MATPQEIEEFVRQYPELSQQGRAFRDIAAQSGREAGRAAFNTGAEVMGGASLANALAAHQRRFDKEKLSPEDRVRLGSKLTDQLADLDKEEYAQRLAQMDASSTSREQQFDVLKTLIQQAVEAYKAEVSAKGSVASAKINQLGQRLQETDKQKFEAGQMPQLSPENSTKARELIGKLEPLLANPEKALSDPSLWASLREGLNAVKTPDQQLALINAFDQAVAGAGGPAKMLTNALVDPQSPAALALARTAGPVATDYQLVQNLVGGALQDQAAKQSVLDAEGVGVLDTAEQLQREFAKQGVGSHHVELMGRLTKMTGLLMSGQEIPPEEWQNIFTAGDQVAKKVEETTGQKPEFSMVPVTSEGSSQKTSTSGTVPEGEATEGAPDAGGTRAEILKLLQSLDNEQGGHPVQQSRALIMQSEGFKRFMRDYGLEGDPDFAWKKFVQLAKGADQRGRAEARASWQAKAAAGRVPGEGATGGKPEVSGSASVVSGADGPTSSGMGNAAGETAYDQRPNPTGSYARNEEGQAQRRRDEAAARYGGNTQNTLQAPKAAPKAAPKPDQVAVGNWDVEDDGAVDEDDLETLVKRRGVRVG